MNNNIKNKIDLAQLEVTKTWKDSGEIEMVSIDDAVNKLKDCYVGDIYKLLRDGKILQSSFAYYEIKLSNN